MCHDRKIVVAAISAACAVAFAVGACRAPDGPPDHPDLAGQRDWRSKLTVRLELDSESGGHRLVLEGVTGWYVNTLYPGISVTLEPSPGAAGEGVSLDREDVVFEDRIPPDKAKRAVFTLPAGLAGGDVRGSYRAVVCRGDVCSPPFTGELPRPGAGE